MKTAEIDRYVESLLDTAEGYADLHCTGHDAPEAHLRLLERLRERTDAEIARVSSLVESDRQREARHEPAYAY